MNMQRINIYDNMKALAIILVVMGHINEFSLGRTNPLWFHFYDSFHMSIFFFVSGLFLFKKFDFSEKITEISKKLCSQYSKRFFQLILPFVIVGILYSYVSSESVVSIFNGHELRFWFLPSLAIDIFITYCVYFLFRFWQVRYFGVRIVLSLIVWIGCYALTYLLVDLKESHYYMMAIRNLPYLGMGVLYQSSPKMKQILRDDRVLAGSFVAFICFLLFGKNWLNIKWGGHACNSSFASSRFSI